ncbi:hypothetical protein LSH36_1423g00026 [Paralvinella palmiformis]|uniref:Uncharacterized protein n=1 Tax=Paralvinella palmiformis TaxID=53620 RepID=A0AAD9ISP5_9ANNE|nr:hypothetical protein LSH36_1423g00026 [Paralvinella palmiformis]
MNDIWTVGGASLRDNFQPSSIHLEPPPYCESPPSYEELKLSFLETKGNPDIGANDLSIEERDTAEHPEENCPQATAPPDEDVVTMTTEYHQPPVVESSSETNQSLTAYDELTHTDDVIDISEEMCNLYSNRDITCYVVNSSQGVDNLGFSVFK